MHVAEALIFESSAYEVSLLSISRGTDHILADLTQTGFGGGGAKFINLFNLI